MSDNPTNALNKVLLENASPELREQFLQMFREQRDAHELQKTHRCWFFPPTPSEYERMRKYAENDRCPKCGRGRVVIEIYAGNIGDNWYATCKWGANGCDFQEYIPHDGDE